MTDKKEYQFELLKETSASEDISDDGTHKNIADALYEMIQNDFFEGINIGLEGGWGSGKSTVVSILRDKVDAKKNTIYFYFDAWQHEGDPLRRIFLEALINDIIKNNNKKIFLNKDNLELLEEIKKKVSNRESTKHIITKRTTTKLGKYLAIATLFVPIGIAIVSGSISKYGLGLNLNGEPHYQFIFGSILALIPLIVIIINLFCIRPFSKKNICDPKNWMFLQSDSDEDIHQEVSENNERTSIEFEKYFYNILDIIFTQNDTKLLIVIDNLDRVDPKDSLKIWSTLQTFLQHRNPHSSDKYSKYSKRIFVLVPYDEEGLEKLWGNNATQKEDQKCSEASSTQQKKEIKEDKKSSAKSFFDKCFQLRIEVPKLLITGWESFCEKNINKALIGWGWNKDEKEKILNVLKWTRESVNDIPTPRDIKTYINQIGLIRSHCDKYISTTAIAYFAVQKYIKFKKNSEIEKGIIEETIPPKEHRPLFPENLASDLCGILYGVSAEKGYQLLLKPEIEKALSSKDTGQINKLLQIHKEAFWIVLNLILPNMNDVVKIKNYSFTVWKELWKHSPDKCYDFIRYLKDMIDKLTALEFPEPNDLNNYEAMFSLLNEGNYDFLKIWEFLITSLSVKMKSIQFDHIKGNTTLSSLISRQNKKPLPYELEGIVLDIWDKWALASIETQFNSYDFVRPPNHITGDITNTINSKTGAPFPDGLYYITWYSLKCGKSDWDKVIASIKVYIQDPRNIQKTNYFSIDILKILLLLSSSNQENFKLIEPFITDHYFYYLTFHLKSKDSVKYAGFLLARYLPENFHSIEVPNVTIPNTGQSSNHPKLSLQDAKDFWKTNNDDNAQFVWNESKLNSNFEFIWKLAENTINKLVGGIIKIAIKEDCLEFFSYPNAIQKLHYAILSTGNEDSLNDELIECFVKYSKIKEEIIDGRDLDIILFAHELYLLIKSAGDEETLNYLANKINTLTKEQWNEVLLNKAYFILLAVTVNKKLSGLNLTDNLYESLLSHLQSWTSKNVPPSDLIKDELPKLILMLKDVFQERLKTRLTSYIVDDVKLNVSLPTMSALLAHINVEKIVTEYKEKFQNITEDSIRKANIDILKVLNIILYHKDGAKFKPDKQLTEVCREPMRELLISNKEKEIKDLIRKLASKFNVDLSLKPNNIISAIYGKGDESHTRDVTNVVKSLVEDAKGEEVSFPVENEVLVGKDDPSVGVLKELKITHSYLEKELIITFNEHDRVTIP